MRHTARALRVAVIALTVMAGACVGIKVDPAGRPCSAGEPCGPGTFCNPQTGTCERGATPDGAPDAWPDGAPDAWPDARLDVTGMDGQDGPAGDSFSPDLLLTPDAGCPPGYTPCGSVCVDVTSDFNHCGECFKACGTDLADTCSGGTCVCGSTGGKCANGLDCHQGDCKCIAGGLCTGCCDGDTCFSLGAAQSSAKCGQTGEACKSCDDGEDCTTDSCLASGACQSTAKTDGTSCEDAVDCTHSDSCQGGICGGLSYACDDGLTCTTDVCTGQAPPGECQFTLQPANCLIGGTCYAEGASRPMRLCYQCWTTFATDTWGPAPGCVITIAGDGNYGFQDGPAEQAQFRYPTDLAVDSAGKVYVTDVENHRIRVVVGGMVTTLAGTGASGFQNGPLNIAQFNEPVAVAVDSAGAVYVAEYVGHRVRLISGGIVSTLAGSGSSGYTDGVATSAEFSWPSAVTVDGAGKVYVAEESNDSVRMISGGQVTTFAGDGSGNSGYQDGPVASARFADPWGIAVDSSGDVYVGDSANNRIRLISAGVVSTLAGSGSGDYQDGPAAQAEFQDPSGVAVDSAGQVLVADWSNHLIRAVSGGQVTTVAGSGNAGFMDGPVAIARFDHPNGVAVDSLDLIYVADTEGFRIRVIRR